MSSHYTTEPAATASATLNTTFGPIHIALFANQTPLTCRNFLQHCMDNYYAGTIFHRVVPDFIVQGGDPTGTGSGGTSIYEYPEFEYDPDARDPDEKVVLRDELHSRLRFNRRGLVGMAKSEDGTYGSQFFITLANTERELNGQCTLFGRIEGDSIFNVLKIADAERVEGTERPVYPVKVTSCEVGELGPLAGKVVKRQVTATTGQRAEDGKKKKSATTAAATKKKKKATKGGKALLSFGGDEEGDEEEEEMPIRTTKPKFNPMLVTDTGLAEKQEKGKENGPESAKGHSSTQQEQQRKRPRSPSPARKREPSSPSVSPSTQRKERPRTPDPLTQLPLPDPESPERSPSPPPAKQSKLSRTNAEIETLKASMRRSVQTQASTSSKPKSALEAMIPETAIRGRKRPPPGSTTTTTNPANGGFGGLSTTTSAESEALKLFNAFKSKLDSADIAHPSSSTSTKHSHTTTNQHDQRVKEEVADEEDEESQLCDLHFIINCQSCKSWDTNDSNNNSNNNNTTRDAADDNDAGWLTHELRFGKDTLGKDLNWKREHQDADTLMVIDPREREKDIVGGGRRGGRGLERDRERERKRGRVGDLEWGKEREKRR